MTFAFVVGTAEQHQVAFSYEKLLGKISITVDGIDAVRTTMLLEVRTTETWEIVVGVQEQHRVRIVKRRPLLLPMFRPHQVTAYVDDVVVAQHQF